MNDRYLRQNLDDLTQNYYNFMEQGIIPNGAPADITADQLHARLQTAEQRYTQYRAGLAAGA